MKSELIRIMDEQNIEREIKILENTNKPWNNKDYKKLIRLYYARAEIYNRKVFLWLVSMCLIIISYIIFLKSF